MRTVAIIQARMSSSRLPGKVFADVVGKPMLHHVLSRTLQAKTLDLVVVATSGRQVDDPVARFCAENGVPCFRGSEDDVLDRYYQAAGRFQADVIARLTADCPLLDPAVIDHVVRVFKEGRWDYVSNTIECTYPDGLDIEVFSYQALERSWREARLRSEREHVTPYMRNQPELFRLGNVKHVEDLSWLRWTVDEPQDLEFVRAVYRLMGSSPEFGMNEVVALLRDHPHLAQINAGIERNEGYRKSLQNDGLIEEDRKAE